MKENIYHSLTNLESLSLHTSEAEVVRWKGQNVLRLNGLVLLSGAMVRDGAVEVEVAAEGAAYPGIAFRAVDPLNFELAYFQPHTSGQWDAIQYDPVFHGSNTWQLYHGPVYQQAADIPLGEWVRFRIDFEESRAAVQFGDQPPLLVSDLAHGVQPGFTGLWTYLPAYFRNFRIFHKAQLPQFPPAARSIEDGIVREWFLDGFGVVSTEKTGLVNINRYLPASIGEVKLIRRFEALSPGPLEIRFGFSDTLTLSLSNQVLFEGQNTFDGFKGRSGRGYVELGAHTLKTILEPGIHSLEAVVRSTEPFGWGFGLRLAGENLRLLPAGLG